MSEPKRSPAYSVHRVMEMIVARIRERATTPLSKDRRAHYLELLRKQFAHTLLSDESLPIDTMEVTLLETFDTIDSCSNKKTDYADIDRMYQTLHAAGLQMLEDVRRDSRLITVLDTHHLVNQTARDILNDKRKRQPTRLNAEQSPVRVKPPSTTASTILATGPRRALRPERKVRGEYLLDESREEGAIRH